jgi:hypothetical protein
LAESEAESVRVELAFEGGQILSALVTVEGADRLERELSADAEGTFSLDASDGRYSVVLKRVVYLKRYAREARVGFGI